MAQAALALQGLAPEPFRPGPVALGVVLEALPEVSLRPSLLKKLEDRLTDFASQVAVAGNPCLPAAEAVAVVERLVVVVEAPARGGGRGGGSVKGTCLAMIAWGPGSRL